MGLDPTASARIATAKTQLREQLRAARDHIDPAAARAAAYAAANILIGRSEVAKARSFALFASIRSELSTAPLALELARRGLKLAYPRILAGRKLGFHWVGSPADLSSAGVWGIAEPDAGAPVAAPGSVDVMVVPGLGFDARGHRLGWGRGYYDGALAEHRDAIRVGFGFDAQVIDEIPAGGGDAPMDLIVTETGAVICSAGRLAASR